MLLNPFCVAVFRLIITRAPASGRTVVTVGSNGDEGTKQYELKSIHESVLQKWFGVLGALQRKYGTRKCSNSIKEVGCVVRVC